MDQPTRPSASGDPAIHAILQRTTELRGDDLVALARSYKAARLADGEELDRRRLVDIAKRRAQRPDDVLALERAVSAALDHATTGTERRSLLRLGILDTAELAILDAVLAVALHDRIGIQARTALAEPWETVA